MSSIIKGIIDETDIDEVRLNSIGKKERFEYTRILGKYPTEDAELIGHLDNGQYSVLEAKDYGDINYYVTNSKTNKTVIFAVMSPHSGSPNTRFINIVIASANSPGVDKLYRFLVLKKNLTLVGDDQSPGARKVWAKAANHPGINVHGFDPNTETAFHLRPTDDEGYVNVKDYGKLDKDKSDPRNTDFDRAKIDQDIQATRHADSSYIVMHKRDRTPVNENELPSWSDLSHLGSMKNKLEYYEAYAKHNANVFESNESEYKNAFERLSKMGDVPSVNSEYIVVVLLLLNNKLSLIQNLELAKLLKINPESYIMELLGKEKRVVEFPIKWESITAPVTTILCASPDTYNKLRTYVSLQFETTLPEYTTPTTENKMSSILKGIVDEGEPKKSVIVGHDATDPEIAVLGGAGVYKLSALKRKAIQEAGWLIEDMKADKFKESARNIKQLANTIETIRVALEEMEHKYFGEDTDMQFATEKTPEVNPHAGLKDRQFRGSIAEHKNIPLKFNTGILESYDDHRRYCIDFFNAYGIDKHHQAHLSNIRSLIKQKTMVLESVDHEEIQQVEQAIDKLSSISNIKVGDSFAVLQFEIQYMNNHIDISGFTEPKEIVKIKTSSNGKIDSILFSDGDSYPRVPYKTGKDGTILVHPAYFNTQHEAEKALTYISMLLPESWEIDTSYLNKGPISETPTDNPTGASGEGGWRTVKFKPAGQIDEKLDDETKDTIRDLTKHGAKARPLVKLGMAAQKDKEETTKSVDEDTAYATGGGAGGNAGQSYRKFKPKMAGTFEGSIMKGIKGIK